MCHIAPLESEEVCPWDVRISAHALHRACERFGVTEDEAEQFIRSLIMSANVARRRKEGVLRWSASSERVPDGVLIITTPFDGNHLEVLTVYKQPEEHAVRKLMGGRIGDRKTRKAAYMRRRISKSKE